MAFSLVGLSLEGNLVVSLPVVTVAHQIFRIVIEIEQVEYEQSVALDLFDMNALVTEESFTDSVGSVTRKDDASEDDGIVATKRPELE